MSFIPNRRDQSIDEKYKFSQLLPERIKNQPLCLDVLPNIISYIPVITNENIRNLVKEYLFKDITTLDNVSIQKKTKIIKQHGYINDWIVSQVTDMSNLFHDYVQFNQYINDWDVSNVTNMEGMFHKAESFNQPLNNWNVSSVRNMNYMFQCSLYFNQPLNNWNVSNVTSMHNMFNCAEHLIKILINGMYLKLQI